MQQSQGSAIAEAAIKRIAKLYAVFSEKLARGKSPEERVATRQKHAKDIFDDLEDWLQAQLPKISGKSPLAQAIRHALGRLPKARPYLENGVLEADNNSVERAMKPVAIGRKNWTFAGSEGGGRAMAIAYTLIEPPSSTKSIRRLGSPGSLAASPTTRITRLRRTDALALRCQGSVTEGHRVSPERRYRTVTLLSALK